MAIGRVGASAIIVLCASLAEWQPLHSPPACRAREVPSISVELGAAVVSVRLRQPDEAVSRHLGQRPAVTTWSALLRRRAVATSTSRISNQPDSTVPPTWRRAFLDDDTEIVLGHATALAICANVGTRSCEATDLPTQCGVGIAVLPPIGKTHAHHPHRSGGSSYGLVPVVPPLWALRQTSRWAPTPCSFDSFPRRRRPRTAHLRQTRSADGIAGLAC